MQNIASVSFGDRIELINGDSAEVLKLLPDNCLHSCVTDPPAGISFMGKEWDDDKGGRDGWITWLAGIMREVYRVLRPGGHALVWAIPKTSHWTAMALEIAGFEIRDVLVHLFGTGFPKSHDVSKAIDKHLGMTEQRPVIGNRPMGFSPGSNQVYGAFSGDSRITSAASPQAREWEGWGTALKPGNEHWILVRKPLVGTIAQNVMAYGTGALNIDGSRIDTVTEEDKAQMAANSWGKGGWQAPESALDARVQKGGFGMSKKPKPAFSYAEEGRWPANVIIDESAAGDLGASAKFFYCPKPSTSERDIGLGDLPIASGADLTGRQPGSAGLANPRRGPAGPKRNVHPTVKSMALMEYLIRLVTPPGGIVLDPFAGSGSTLLAVARGGWCGIGIEREREYAEIAARRIQHVYQKSLPPR